MKRITSLVLMALVALCGTSAWAQSPDDYTVIEDLSTTKLQNANFSQGTPVDILVRTYAKDLADNGAGADGVERYGQQPVQGWTAGRPTDNIKNDPSSLVGGDACAAGLFPYMPENYEGDETRPGLGGAFYPPFQSSEVTGNCLGLTAVWNASTVQYTQDVTLPAGAYMMVVKYINVGAGTGIQKNLTGFIVSDTEQYMMTKTTFDVGMVEDAVSGTVSYNWSEDFIVFQLSEEKTGKISLGFASNNVGSAGTVHLFIDQVRLCKIDPNDLVRDEINAKKVELLQLIEIGTAYGVDTSASQAVFNNPSATLAQVEAAIENQKAINASGTTDFSEYFIQNPHFTMDDAVDSEVYTYAKDMDGQAGGSGTGGWGIAEGGASRYGSQPITGWITYNETDNIWRSGTGGATNGRASGIFNIGGSEFLGGAAYLPPTTMSDGSSTGKVLGMVTCWTNIVQYTQYVTIPAGKYILSVSYYNTGGTVAINKNLIGFVADDGTEYLCTNTTFPVGRWSTEEIEFELTEETSGYFSMGYKSADKGSGDMPHFFIDGISLVYIGTGVNVSLEALKAAVRTANNTMTSNQFSEALTTQLKGLVATGQTLIDNNSSDNDANQAATEAINSLMPAIQENIKAYAALDNFAYGTDGALTKAWETYTPATTYVNVNAFLEKVTDDADNALNYYTLSTAEINTLINSFEETLKSNLQSDWYALQASGTVLDEPMNISALFTTLGVTYSTSAVGGDGKAANVPDKQWNYGSATNFKTQYGTMEVWNQSPMTVSQTMTEMPAGTYTIATRGFYRTADNATNMSTYSSADERAFVFAGSESKRTALANQAIVTRPDAADNWALVGDVYVPNGQASAYSVFTDPTWDPTTYASVKTVLSEEGDLTFGITTEQMDPNCWVVWHTFELYYNNSSAADVNDEIAALTEEIGNMISEPPYDVLGEVSTYLDQAYNKGDAAIGSGDKEVITSLRNTIAQAKADKAKYEALLSEADIYQGFYDQYAYTSSNNGIQDLINQIKSGDGYATMAEVDDANVNLAYSWYNHVRLQDTSAASETTPVDMTGLFRNADLELQNFKYWKKTDDIGTNVGYQANTTYPNAEGETVIEHFLEAWRAGEALSDGELKNTTGYGSLPNGYYTLECDAFVRFQDGLPEGETLKGVYLFASVGAGTKFRTPITGNNENVAQHFSVTFKYGGTAEINGGILVEGTNANWFVADNFKLSYLGTEVPSAIEATEADAQGAAVKSIYSLTGARQATLQKGINIVVDQNGKARKVFVK